MDHAAYMREWRARPENAERIREAKRQSYLRNREAVLARQKEARDPEAKRAYAAARRQADPERVRVLTRDAARRRRDENPERVQRQQRAWRLRHRYGLTESEFSAMFEAQGGRCAICYLERDLVVDHDHKTGRVRGLLCGPCNLMLGVAQDDPQRLLAAVRFLG